MPGRKSRVDLPENRDEFVPYLVSEVFYFRIAAVFPECKAVFPCKGFDVIAVREKQRADEVTLPGKDPVKPGNTGASQKVNEKCLHLVVEMMGSSDSIIFFFFQEFIKP